MMNVPVKDSKDLKNNNKLLGIGLGLILIVVFLHLIIFNPDPYMYSLYKILTSVGVALIANSLTGYIHLNIGKKLRAGGSLGIFLLIYYLYPIENQNSSGEKWNFPPNECNDSLRYVNVVLTGQKIISVRKGEVVEVIYLDGEQNLGPVVGDVGPAGTDGGPFGLSLKKYCIAKNLPHGAVIFKFSNDNDWKVLSRDTRFNVTKANSQFRIWKRQIILIICLSLLRHSLL